MKAGLCGCGTAEMNRRASAPVAVALEWWPRGGGVVINVVSVHRESPSRAAS